MQESLFNNDAGFSQQLYYEKILTQESSLTIFKHPFLWNTPSTSYYEVRQPRHLMKTSNTPFYEARQFFEARQARQFFEARQARHFMKHAKHVGTPSTPARKAREHAKHVSKPST